MELVTKTKPIELRLYNEEMSDHDTVGDECFTQRAYEEFGKHIVRGTALMMPAEEGERYVVEELFRSILEKQSGVAIEIGTFRGVTTAMLAHYFDKVYTIDLIENAISAEVWKFFGILPKIKSYVVADDEAKQHFINSLDFDFAFIDGDHTYEGVALDFELVRKCGKVVFHDYAVSADCKGVTDFVNELPTEEVIIKRPFAIWTAKETTYKNAKLTNFNLRGMDIADAHINTIKVPNGRNAH